MGCQCCKTRIGPQPVSARAEVISLEVALTRYLNAVVTLRSCERDVTVAQWKVSQILCDSLFSHDCIPLRRVYIGSYYEGVPLEVCSDNNMFLVNESFPYVLPEARWRPPEGCTIAERQSTYVIPEANEENPAYTRLIIPAEFTNKLDILIHTSSCTYDSQPHLSGHLFKTRVSTRGLGRQSARKRAENEMYDELHCLHCPAWPRVAEEWANRVRARDWPPQNLVRKIQEEGCHLLPTGHPRSKDRDLQWRWMFSRAERTLVHALSDAQGSSLYLLKAITKFITSGAESPGIGSYHVKTAAFWTFETYVTRNVTVSVIDLARQVLKTLHKFYSEWNLPHYFIPKQNLINQISQYKCRKVAKQIEDIVNEYDVYVLSSLSMGTQTPFYINCIREEIGLITKPRQNFKDHQAFIKRLMMSENNVASLVKVIRLVQTGSRDYQTVRKIHVLDAMENIKVDIINAMKQVVKLQRKAANMSLATMTTPLFINGAGAANKDLPHGKSSTLTSSKALAEEAAVYERVLDEFERIIATTQTKLSSALGGDQLEAYKLFIQRGLAEAYFYLSLLATATRIGQKCQEKAIDCLVRTMEIVYQDHENVFIFDGHFNMALFYYQNCDYNKVIDVMKEMRPSPHDADFVLVLESSVYPITINPGGPEEELNKWRGDWELFRSLGKRRENLMVNPGAFAYYMYIQARRVLGYVLEDAATSHVTSNVTSNVSAASTRHASRFSRSETEISVGRLTPISLPSQATTVDEDLLDKMQNSHYSYGADASNLLLKILCE